jgi:serine/threonine protein kinase/WD40 repeat protein
MSTPLEKVEELFNRAIELRPEERESFLAGACGEDCVLRSRVQALLEAHEAGDSILPEEPQHDATTPLSEKPGAHIGRYKLLEQIGEGGCGIVYMAEQSEPVRRRVALKIIKLGMDTKRVVARFEAERQALALMDHPNIAKVFDAGTTQTGRPFFVMELVRGTRITDYCQQNDLSTAQRLELMVQVCRAIQHAHQKGIIHRDIKPSNVLITIHDGEPVPKVIDFGIAKAIEGRLTDQTLFTSFEQFMGTPAYMSPEQAQLDGLDVDTRSDVYSLGVLLYELLTGNTPFDAKDLLAAGLDEMRRTIREKEPPRPSTKLTLELDRGESQNPRLILPPLPRPHAEALRRRRELIHVLRGDLDWIVMKCLEKDRRRRYETANGVATDIERHLRSEPVVARPPSSLYRLQKLVRRNSLTFGAGAAVAVALILGIIASTWEAIRARQAEQLQVGLREEAEQARRGEARERATAEQHLYDALLGEARAKQLSGRAGQRFESLDAISKAAAIHRSKDLSDAAVAAFALPDLREKRSWRFPSHWVAENVCFDDQFQLYAYRTLSGISIRHIQDDQELVFLAVKDVDDIPNGLVHLRFDPRSRYFRASCSTRDKGSLCRVWDLARDGALALELDNIGNPDFSPDGQALAGLDSAGVVVVKAIGSGKDLLRLHVNGRPRIVRFNPAGTLLAGLEPGSTNVTIWDAVSGQVMTTLSSSGSLTFFAWDHEGSLLAIGRLDGGIELWDVASSRLLTRLDGHQARVSALAFTHQGDMLASGSWDSTLRLWDVTHGRQLILYRTQDTEFHFSGDDRMLAYAVEGETTKLLEVTHSTGHRRLVSRAEMARPWTVDFSADGRLIAVGSGSGLGFWDAGTGCQIGFLPTAECRSAHFQTYGGFFVVGSTSDGLYRWPLRTESTAAGSFLRVGAPEMLAGQEIFRYSALDRGGRRILASREVTFDPVLLDLSNPTNLQSLQGHPGAQFVSLDPSGRWGATGSWKGAGVKVYEVPTGRLIRDLPAKGTAFVSFSPDGNWLAAADMMAMRLWKTGSWQPGSPQLPGDGVSEINPLAFSPDSRLLAAVHSINEIQILKVPSCEKIATLRAPVVVHLRCLGFSPDGTRLAACDWSGQIDVWDLRLTREELRKMNLDWDLPPFPAASDVPPIGPVVSQLDAGPFSKEELAQSIPPREADIPASLLDLSEYYNAPLTESWHSPKEAHNDLSALGHGIKKLGDVDFDVRGLIQIGTKAPNHLAYPNHVRGIPIRRQSRKLHFLQAAIFAANARLGDELGSYVFHYADGKQIEVPIIARKDLAEWWSQPDEQDSKAVIAWTGNNPAARADGHILRLFRMTWENPMPGVAIRDFDFVSDKPTPGAPFLLAVTVEP